ncbi:phage holin family protein [Bacillus sp. B190/17]|uniref:Phage holin family protein n=1 Tax=Bacillus lumedeiriae TaxID=3058829 RepID=A0ABW8IB62_9BACI
MDFHMYIRSDAFILVPVLYFIGLLLRQTPHIPFWSHAWIKLSFAVIACLLHYGFAIESVVQGILVTGATVVSRDLIHHTIYGLNEQKSGRKWDPHKGAFISTEEEKEKKDSSD